MECTGPTLPLSYLNHKMICGCRPVVMETADRMKKNVIRRSKEHHPHNANFVASSDHPGYNASAASFRRVHVAIRALASLYTVGILCSIKVIWRRSSYWQDSDRLHCDSVSLGKCLRTLLRSVGWRLPSDAVTQSRKPAFLITPLRKSQNS
jgi:hypothetical protein